MMALIVCLVYLIGAYVFRKVAYYVCKRKGQYPEEGTIELAAVSWWIILPMVIIPTLMLDLISFVIGRVLEFFIFFFHKDKKNTDS